MLQFCNTNLIIDRGPLMPALGLETKIVYNMGKTSKDTSFRIPISMVADRKPVCISSHLTEHSESCLTL